MTHPYREYLRHHPSKNVSRGNLVITGPLEGFTTRLKISVYLGIGLAAPVLFWELWRFITPGLHKNEKRYVVPFVARGGLPLLAPGSRLPSWSFPRLSTG